MLKINVEKIVDTARAPGGKWYKLTYKDIAEILEISRSQFMNVRQQKTYEGATYGDNERFTLNLRVIDGLCRELDITPCDIIEYVPDQDD